MLLLAKNTSSTPNFIAKSSCCCLVSIAMILHLENTFNTSITDNPITPHPTTATLSVSFGRDLKTP